MGRALRNPFFLKKESSGREVRVSIEELDGVREFFDVLYAFYIIEEGEVSRKTGYSNKNFVVLNCDDSVEVSAFLRCESDEGVAVYRIREKVSRILGHGEVEGFFDASPSLLAEDFSFILSGDYKRLKEFGYIPRPGVSPIKVLGEKVLWEYDDRNVESCFHCWRFLKPVFSEFLIRKNENLIEEALELVNDWCLYASLNGRSKFVEHDMPMGQRAMHLAFLIWLIRSGFVYLGEKKKRVIIECASFHIDYLLKHENITSGNHAVYQAIGLKLLLIESGVEEGERKHTDLVMERLFDNSFDEFGLGTENSPFYHVYLMQTFRKVSPRVFPNIYDKIQSKLKKAKEIIPWLLNPQGMYLNIGDTDEQFPSQKNVKTRKPDFVIDLFEKKYSIRDISKSGYVVARSSEIKNNTLIVFYGMNQSYVHAHCDYLSFIVFHEGIEILGDSGKYAYEGSSVRDFFSSDSAHNTVGLKGNPFSPKDVDIKNVSLSPPATCLDGSLRFEGSVVKPGIFHRRELFFNGCGILVRDHIRNSTNVNTVLRFQFSELLDVVLLDRVVEAYFDGKAVARVVFSRNALDIVEKRGAFSPAMQGWVSRKYGEKKERSTIEVEVDSEEKVVETFIGLL